MTAVPLWRASLAEAVGTGLLVTVVVGSGIAAERLSTDAGLRLLENSTATALGLFVIIVLLAPVSGAHLNPAVTLASVVLDRRRGRDAAAFVAAQTAGAIGGALLANAMFSVTPAVSRTERADAGTVLAEVVATAGLVLLVAGLTRAAAAVPVIAAAVGAYIGAAYWFTSSTAFANPAATIGRVVSDTFAGIAPASAGAFLLAQLVGATVGILLTMALFPRRPDAKRAHPAPGAAVRVGSGSA
ncbi:aquaporin [Microbacterium sp. NPDC077663]|uniref:aquaporin n=1 Tax=Microbacterium sp. NPDC077663 TaxID=3364189 RepID=UPI0037C4FAC8